MQEYDRLVCECTESTVDACYDVGDATRGDLIGFGRLESYLEEDDLREKEKRLVHVKIEGREGKRYLSLILGIFLQELFKGFKFVADTLERHNK